jgi:uncharacterized repeat protein (TIGR03803 family)
MKEKIYFLLLLSCLSTDVLNAAVIEMLSANKFAENVRDAELKYASNHVWNKMLNFTSTTHLEAASTSVIVEPASGSEYNEFATLKVSISAVEGASRYTVELSADGDFSGDVLSRTSIRDNQTEFTFTGLMPGTTYFGRVKIEGSETYGQVTSFTTRESKTHFRLYGVTSQGGANGLGTVFSYSIDSAHFLKHDDYKSENGAHLHGALVPTPSGRFVGVSVYDGTGFGELYYLDKSGKVRLFDNYGPHNGEAMLGSDNYLYVLDDWINVFRGGIFRIYEKGDHINPLNRTIFRFSEDEEGINPAAALIEANGYLYGVAPLGGNSENGVVYRLRADGTDFRVLHHFTGTTGAYPNASLTTTYDGYLYGMTPNGGASGLGVVFRVKQDGSDFSKLVDFDGTNGSFPQGSLLISGSTLFGMTREGGSHGQGIIFKMNLDGSGFTKLWDFNGTAGAQPLGTLTFYNDVLYGLTSRGGDFDKGVLFSIRPDGSAYTTLVHFSDETGSFPDGKLVAAEDLFEPVVANFAAKPAAVSLHPNPFENSFIAKLDTDSQANVQFSLFHVNGSLLKNISAMPNTTVELGDGLERGIYILKIVQGDKISVHRVIKK